MHDRLGLLDRVLVLVHNAPILCTLHFLEKSWFDNIVNTFQGLDSRRGVMLSQPGNQRLPPAVDRCFAGLAHGSSSKAILALSFLGTAIQ